MDLTSIYSGQDVMQHADTRCKYCGSTQTAIQHQSCAADEAPSLLVVCTECPISLKDSNATADE